ncbi:MAG: putative zinc-binding metallopeptidase [Candidatus Binatia bacterium]
MSRAATARRQTTPKRRIVWSRYPKERLLGVRLSDLGLRIEDSWLEECVEEVYRELERRGLRFRPHVWLSQEWFSPDGVPGVAMPFYLAHPRLMRLERGQMLEVEGGTREECIRILRHEFGHALQHAWGLQRRRRWQELFGPSSKKYPDHYRPNPASRRYVQHLRLYYAQSHPDEDFAETFAVWLQPRPLWRKRYAGWPALKKLDYVDELMNELRGSAPPNRSRRQVEPLRALRITLRQHYAEKRRHYTLNYPDIYDRDLRKIFSADPRHRNHERASSFLRRNRSEIRQLVARWTGEYQFTLDQVLNDIIGRCRELRLRAVGPERRLRIDFAVLLTVKTMHFLYNRRNWISL